MAGAIEARPGTSGGQQDPRLRRGVGFWGLLGFSVGINIGAGLFILVNVSAGLSGTYLPIAMLVAALPAFIALIPYTVLACAYPTTAATYRYIQLLHPGLGVAAVTALFAAVMIGGQPLFALMAGLYLTELVPVSPTVIGVAALTTFYVVNLVGVRPTAAVQTILVTGLVAAVVLFAVMGLGHLDADLFVPDAPEGIVGVLAGGGVLFALMAGGLFIIDVGDEVVAPHRLYRTVLPLGMMVVFALYWAVIVVSIGVLPAAELEGATLVAVAERFMGDATLAVFILAGAMVAALTTMNVTYTLVSRSMLAVARDGLIPEAIGRVNARYGTPHWALTIAYVASLGVFLADPSRELMGTILNIGLVAAIALVALSAARLPRHRPHLLAASGTQITERQLKAAGYTVVALNGLIVVMLAASLPAAMVVLAVLGAAGWLYWRLRGRTPPAWPEQGYDRGL